MRLESSDHDLLTTSREDLQENLCSSQDRLSQPRFLRNPSTEEGSEFDRCRTIRNHEPLDFEGRLSEFLLDVFYKESVKSKQRVTSS